MMMLRALLQCCVADDAQSAKSDAQSARYTVCLHAFAVGLDKYEVSRYVSLAASTASLKLTLPSSQGAKERKVADCHRLSARVMP